MGLAEARQRHNKYCQLLAEKIDPTLWLQEQHNKEGFEQTLLLQHVCHDWFRIKFAKISTRYAFNIQRSFELHVLPKLGKLPIKMLTAQRVIDVLRPLERNAKFETVSRLCQRLNELMNWCINTGLLASHQLSGIKAAFIKPQSVHMRTIAAEHLPELMRSLNSEQLALSSRCLIEWQLHTMVRPGEAAKTRWQDIDFDNSIWVIPAKFMKMRREHKVPLSRHALAILNIMRPISYSSDYVFASPQQGASHLNRDTVNNAIKTIGFNEQLVAHGLRALASTVLNEKGFNSDWIEAALAHCDKNSVRAIYNKATYLKQRTRMMAWWSNYIEAAADGRLCTSQAEERLKPSNYAVDDE